jgi:hypothetical protein
MKHFLSKIKFFKIKSLSIAFLILLLWLFVIYKIRMAIFYDLPPRENVVEHDLNGKLRFKDGKLFARPSIMILRKDGSYEIHNPPLWLRKMCEFPTKIYETKSCGEIIIGEWSLTRFSKQGYPYVRLEGIKGLTLEVHGRYPPYQLWYYRAGPELSPLRCWQWYSGEIQCLHCLGEEYWLHEIKEPIYESDSFDHERLEEGERESIRHTWMAIGILLMLMGVLYEAITLYYVVGKKK